MSMRLIDEIRAAATVWEKDSASAAEIVESPWWPRIRDALLAGEEMAKHLESEYHYGTSLFATQCSLCQIVARFRAATEGTK